MERILLETFPLMLLKNPESKFLQGYIGNLNEIVEVS